MEFSAFDADVFLRDYWQQKPLLLKNPWREWRNPLEPDELAGLACEEDIESRLIMHDVKRDQWKLENGPLAEQRFGKLPAQHWTLLVQAVDQWVPEVAALLEPFRFLPNWRIDDVMVSYAADQGGVGPHFDQYDVFLIQGLGRRRWQVGELCGPDTELLDHQQLRLLKHFAPTQEWLLEPGDILYLPPRYAHNGIAEGENCMTYSVGLRAPSRADLVSHWCDHVLAGLSEDDRFTDTVLSRSNHPGEITGSALDTLRRMALERLSDESAFRRWFGGYATTRKYPELDDRPEQPITPALLRERLDAGESLLKNPASRLAFVKAAEIAQDADVLLFADGQQFPCPLALAECLSVDAEFSAGTIGCGDAVDSVLAGLYNQGTLVFEDEAGLFEDDA